jgi:hypothetical protein
MSDTIILVKENGRKTPLTQYGHSHKIHWGGVGAQIVHGSAESVPISEKCGSAGRLKPRLSTETKPA